MKWFFVYLAIVAPATTDAPKIAGPFATFEVCMQSLTEFITAAKDIPPEITANLNSFSVGCLNENSIKGLMSPRT